MGAGINGVGIGINGVNICRNNVHICRVSTIASTNQKSMRDGHNSLGTMTCGTRHKSGPPIRP